MQKTKICQQCGGEIKNQNIKYCCMKCSVLGKKTKIEKQCVFCGKSFEVAPHRLDSGRGKYCSKICFRENKKTQRTKIKCVVCGIVVETFKKNVEKGKKYCSLKCKGIDATENSLDIFICKVCGKVKLIKKSEIKGKKFCSYKCCNTFRSENGRTKRTCKTCGKKFVVTLSVLRKNHGIFCSNSCLAEWLDGKNKVLGITRKFIEEKYIKEEKTIQEIADIFFCSIPTVVARIESYGYHVEESSKYRCKIWHKTRKMVYARDDYTCKRCGVRGGKTQLHAHHLSSYKNVETRYDMKNLITLCKSCHDFVHSNKNKDNEYLTVQTGLFCEIADNLI